LLINFISTIYYKAQIYSRWSFARMTKFTCHHLELSPFDLMSSATDDRGFAPDNGLIDIG
jgi:hypothetical protein